MAKIIFKVLFNLILTVLNVVLLPINLAVSTMFPSFANLVSTFNSLVVQVVGDGLAYFSSLLPPMTKSFILLYLSILIAYYTISISVHAFIKIFSIIKKIKFW